MSEKNIQTEIYDTIVSLCKEIQHIQNPTLDKVELIKATAELIQSTKDRGIF
jgi:hypothetical protein